MAAVSTGNLLLDRLDSDLYAALGAEAMHFETGARLLSAGETPEFVFFPAPGAVLSIVRGTSEGSVVETGLAGMEAFSSVHSIIAPPQPTRTETILQLGNDVIRVPCRRAREAFDRDSRFREGTLACTNDLLIQNTQNVVCNRLHLLEQRLAKWLLLLRDRVGSDELRLTHEFIAQMLGIHRPGVSIAIDALELDGLIQHARNRILIRDASLLATRSCECAAVANESLSTLRSVLSS